LNGETLPGDLLPVEKLGEENSAQVVLGRP
jgi:hypothetical protein